jgi:hypothetical protein
MPPIARGLAVTAVTAVLALGATSCTGDSGGDAAAPAGGSSSTGSASSASQAAPAPGSSATAFPVPASASPAPLPSLGSREGQGYTVTLNSLQRVGPQSGLLTATVTSTRSRAFDEFTEPGYLTVLDPVTRKPLGNAYDFSAVTLSTPGDDAVYKVLRDEDQRCACTTGLLSVPANQPFGVYAYVTLPERAAKVTVTVKGLAPFRDVPVTS